MAYELILYETLQGDTKALGENVFLADLNAEYPVFAFYYPSEMPDHHFENLLRKLGEETGANLFVNIGRLNDPNFGKLASAFDITSFPSLVLTAVADLAAPEKPVTSAYVRLDGRMLADPERAIAHIESLYLLFLRGEIAEAIKKAGHQEKREIARIVGRFIASALTNLTTFIANHDLSISILQGSFEIKKSGSS